MNAVEMVDLLLHPVQFTFEHLDLLILVRDNFMKIINLKRNREENFGQFWTIVSRFSCEFHYFSSTPL